MVPGSAPSPTPAASTTTPQASAATPTPQASAASPQTPKSPKAKAASNSEGRGRYQETSVSTATPAPASVPALARAQQPIPMGVKRQRGEEPVPALETRRRKVGDAEAAPAAHAADGGSDDLAAEQRLEAVWKRADLGLGDAPVTRRRWMFVSSAFCVAPSHIS